MFQEIADLLTSDEVEDLRGLARGVKFVEGRITNPHSKVKNNLHADTRGLNHQQASELLGHALARHAQVSAFAFPKRMAPPVLTKYTVGMNYGVHADTAFIPMGTRPVRADLSCTIFLNPLEDYDGGELSVHLGSRALDFRLPPGGAVIYPSTTLHEVRPVTRGERLCGITFIESEIVDRVSRELLFEMNDVLAQEADRLSWDGITRLNYIRSSLQRQWGDAA
ncbi:Fe2+-dependent dioxygenase [Phenylobacterium sp.]|uniref:Fe2+-dependent dioxygenase n=1 Tax=Phenylobacterium sp. TaxID=1871053 RepID=UPI0025FE5F40|nr:Fe2+-dependent dioxygenase [Phenylobacterium sp.]